MITFINGHLLLPFHPSTDDHYILRTSTLWANNDLVTLVNLFTSNDSTLAAATCEQPGNLLAWNIRDWQFDRRFPKLVFRRRVPTSSVCRSNKADDSSPPPFLLPIPVTMNVEEGIGLCARLGAGAGRLASFADLTQWQTFWDINILNQMETPDNVFWPYRRISPDGDFYGLYNLTENGQEVCTYLPYVVSFFSMKENVKRNTF